MQKNLLNVNSIQLHVTEDGSGPPLLLLHGLTASAELMEPEITGLARSFRVIAPDLRGHGRSDRPDTYTLNDHVQDMTSLLDALDLRQVAVLGVSMGSHIAQAIALAAPERISALILVVTKASGASASTARYLEEHADEVEEMTSEQVRLWLAGKVFAPEAPLAIKQQAHAFMTSQSQAGLSLSAAQTAAANQAIAGFDFRSDLQQLRMPTLVISGRYDIFNPPAAGEEVARLIPGAQFEVLEHAGHMATLEETPRFLELVGAFLKP